MTESLGNLFFQYRVFEHFITNIRREFAGGKKPLSFASAEYSWNFDGSWCVVAFSRKNFGYRRQAQLLRESITEKSTTAWTNTATQTQFFRQEASGQQQSSAEKGNGDAR